MNKNNFAKTPPRGWNSYDYYDTTVNEAEIKAAADVMAKKLLSFGYEYIVVDIQWYAYDTGSMRDKYQYIPFGKCEMDSFGRLLPCPQKFPSSKDGQGFKPLADYVHDRGLKFGIHIMRGIPRKAAHDHMPVKGSVYTADMLADPNSICDWNPDMYGLRDCAGSQAYYDSLLELYASWGVDFIKCDDICNTHAYKERPYMGKHEVEMLHRAIEKCGRDIVLSLSPGPALIDQAAHYCANANMWRISDDFWDNWPLLRKMFDYCEIWQYVISEGCWPDCDMLPVGKIGRGFNDERTTRFTKEEQQTMFAMWCLFKSPLMIGGDLTKLDDWTYQLLTDSSLLKLQDRDYRPRQVEKNNDYAIWMTDSLQSNEVTAAVFNFKDKAALIETGIEKWRCVSRIDMRGPSKTPAAAFFGGKLTEEKQGVYTVQVPAHGVTVFRVIF